MRNEKLLGGVLVSKLNKSLIIANNRYYIIKGEHPVGTTLEFNVNESSPMPSYLFAVAAMEEEDLDATIDYIKTNWIKNN